MRFFGDFTHELKNWVCRLPLLALLLVSPNLALADNNDPPTTTAIINLYGYTLKYPLPDWIPQGQDPKNAMSQSRYERMEDASMFIMQAVPKAQNFQTYKDLQLVAAFRRLGSSLETSVSQIVGLARSTCKPDRFFQYATRPLPDTALVTTLCGELGEPALSGRSSIVHSRITYLRGTTIVLAREWRAKAFDLEAITRKNLPISRAEFEAVSNSFVSEATVIAPDLSTH